ncbi:Peptidase family M48 [Cnuella takakiae]|uniref:Peptidase family M48 n=1 Tax=Cnuella takakiae TaxID=1302690 RepID=A0A1M5EU08_9BACT|nr:M48 family metallopeptidase [Cnuella takakiae]SHF82502.1 Peptidase family M48 [Cnuella takakiae]
MNATYTCNGLSYPATIRLEGKGLFIELHRADGAGTVLWQYASIRPSERASFFGYNDYPPQTLEVLDAVLTSQLHEALRNPANRFRASRFGPLAKLLAIVLVLFSLVYFLVVPWVSGLLASRFPYSYEKQLGEQVYRSMVQPSDIDKPATAAANRFFQALQFDSEHPVRITVVKGDVVNAFALPGGHIIVYQKLLRGLDSYDEFAALLAHEFVHVRNRHTLRSVFRQFGGTIFLSLLVGDAGAVSAVLLNNVNELKNLSYSRRLETEADMEGLQLLRQRGISCRGFVQLFRFLQKESGAMQPSEWLSSHPDLSKRIGSIQRSGTCTEGNKDEQLHSLFLQLKTAE